MKRNWNSYFLPAAAAVAGAAAALLRMGLYAWGLDEKGLLIPGHPLALGVWGITILTAVLTVLALRDPRPAGEDIPAVTAAGYLVLAAGIGLTVFCNREVWLTVEKLRNGLGLAAAAALLWLGWCRWKRKTPFFAFHALVCLYLALHTISHYQIWCSRPQMQNYLFPMAASLLLALSAYCCAAEDVSLGKARTAKAGVLLGIFFCLAAAVREDASLYLPGALWLFTRFPGIVPAPRKDDGHEAA